MLTRHLLAIVETIDSIQKVYITSSPELLLSAPLPCLIVFLPPSPFVFSHSRYLSFYSPTSLFLCLFFFLSLSLSLSLFFLFFLSLSSTSVLSFIMALITRERLECWDSGHYSFSHWLTKCWLSETIGDSGLSSPGLSLPFLLVGFSSVPVLYMY